MPSNECALLKSRIEQLKVKLKYEQHLLDNALLAADKLKHQENIERILESIEFVRARMDEIGCEPHIPFPPPPLLPGLGISGVEVTQAIQYHRASAHLTDPADQGADNSVRLVANKPAWVRVYVRSTDFSDVANVTGTLGVERLSPSGQYLAVTTINPQAPGSITAFHNPGYVAERSTIGATLNFVIPANQMIGNMRLRATVSEPANGYLASKEIEVAVTLRQTLRLAGIMVGYNGSNDARPPNIPMNITLAPPQLADLQATSAFTLTTMPVQSTATYRIAGTITWTRPLTDAQLGAGGCSQNWLDLNTAVQTVRTNDGNQSNVIYYGLLAAGIPMGPVVGCNTGGVSSGSNGDQVAMAHEIGHYVGLAHAPCSVPGDLNYPAYEPYDAANTPNASIGEYGLNINNGTILSPQVFRDYMSYCAPGWISLYHHGRLINNNMLAPVVVDGGGLARWKDYVMMNPSLTPEQWLRDPPVDVMPGGRFRSSPESLISIIGIVRGLADVEVRSVARVTAHRSLPNSERTELTAELLDSNGNVISSGPLYRLPSHSQGCCGGARVGGSGEDPEATVYVFQSFIPDTEPGAALRIRRGENEVWRRDAPEEPPTVEHFRARVSEATLEVETDVRVGEGAESEYWMQWSPDEGETWQGLTVGLSDRRAAVDLSALPPGKVLVRLLAHDGFFTATSDPVEVEVPKRSPSAAIMQPPDAATIEAGSTLRLWGTGTDGSGQPVEPGFARWLIDGEEVARGLDVFVTAPTDGAHRATLIVESEGQSAQVTVAFETVR